jgi:diguanylate cyclase (GGDEF)-like protein
MLTRTVVAFDSVLARRSRIQIIALAIGGVLLVGYVDFLTGYEVSMYLFYLGPITIAAWYVGSWSGVSIAMLACLGWYVADAGHIYSHPSIPIWNAVVRLEVFLIFALLLKSLRDHVARERNLAQTDALTGLFGRRAFLERLEHDLALAQRRNSFISIAFVDLDDFKAVNDRHGHAEGDRVLLTIGRALSQVIRRADTAARLGGDEFALILPDTGSDGARRLIGEVVRRIEQALAAGATAVTCSVGVVTYADARVTVENALAAADALMYDVKRTGKGSAAFSVIGEPRTEASVGALRVARR